jgi:hypothetical protein
MNDEIMETSSTANNIPYKICEHVKDNGIRCGSPAVSGERHCHFHRRTSDAISSPGDPGYTLPVLETEQSVQIALQQMMAALLSGKLSERKAGVMLAGIKTAAALIRQAQAHTPKQDLLNEIADELRARLPVRTNSPEPKTALAPDLSGSYSNEEATA